MSTEDAKTMRDLLKFSKGLWAELQSAGFSDKDSPEPWQFVRARAATEAARTALKERAACLAPRSALRNQLLRDAIALQT